MSASESESGTLYGAFADRLQRRLRRDVERDPDARDHARAVLLGREEVVSTSGFESGIGVRSFTQPRRVGLITTGPKA